MDPTTYSDEYLAETQQTTARNLSIAITVFALIFVAFRVFVRLRWATGMGIDDWTILVSTVFFLVLAAMNLLMIKHGMGLHLTAVKSEDFSIVFQSVLAAELAYNLTIALTKISILLMYCRVFPVKSVKRGAVVLGFITIAWAIATILVSIFQCKPIRKAWLPNVQGHCIDIGIYFMGNSGPNIGTDIAILMLPMVQVWKLQTNITRKISITVMIMLGSLSVFPVYDAKSRPRFSKGVQLTIASVIAASIYRLIQFMNCDPSDLTWTMTRPSTWTVVEAAAALVSACLPTLGPTLRVLKVRLGIQTTSSRSRNIGNTSVDLITIGGTHRRRDGAQTGQHWSRSETDNFKRLEENSSLDGSRDFAEARRDNTSDVSTYKGSRSTERDDGSGDEVPPNYTV